MVRLAKNLILILSLVYIGQTAAAPGPCTSNPGPIGNLFSSELLTEPDFRAAIACAVNRGGHDVIGESSFRSLYDLRIDEADLAMIHAERRPELEPSFNQKNIYAVRFRAVYENRLLTLVRCTATVDLQKLPRLHVVMTLTECKANAFGETPGHPLQAMVAYSLKNKNLK